MELNQFSLELNGIVGTILDYTRDPYIVGYTNSLEKSIQENNTELQKLTVQKLIHWYHNHISEIMESQYIYNKDNHVQTLKYLEDFYTTLQ